MPYEYLVPTGEIVPDTTDTLASVQIEYKFALGQSMNTAPQTPQGRLIDVETISRNSAARNNAQTANQFNPNYAEGIFLDASLALMGSKRNSTTYTVSLVNLTGTPGLPIPANVLIQHNISGEQFMTVTGVTLSPSGQASVNAQAVNPGPISAAPGTLTVIVASTAVLGWETVTNPSSPISIGTLTQADEPAGNFRIQTLGAQSNSQAESMIAALYLTPNVTSVFYFQNDLSMSQTVGTVVVPGKSIYLCIAGGRDSDVASTINTAKGPGAAYTPGNTSVVVTNPFSGQVVTVEWDRPTPVDILVQVTARVMGVIGDPIDAIKTAILDYAVGNIPGQQGLKIGVPVSAFELSGACNIEIPQVFIQQLLISKVSPLDYSCDLIPIEINEQASIVKAGISVVLV